MPKIRDLAINTIPANVAGHYAGVVAMSVPEPPNPTPPQCKPSPECKPSPPQRSTHASGVPLDAVIQMKQQLQQRVKRHVYS